MNTLKQNEKIKHPYINAALRKQTRNAKLFSFQHEVRTRLIGWTFTHSSNIGNSIQPQCTPSHDATAGRMTYRKIPSKHPLLFGRLEICAND